MYEDEYDNEELLSGGKYQTERLEQALAAERSLDLELQMEQDEEKKHFQADELPEKRKLKRELQAEALARLEDAARTADDFRLVTQWWDKLDANRERRDRYHELSRSGDDVPLDYGAAKDGLLFPDALSSVLAKQMRRGDFLDVIFNCPYEIHELVTEEYLSEILRELSEDHKEILFLHAVQAFSSKRIGEIRGQSDRNIRKVRATMFNRIYRKLLPILTERMEKGLPMTKEETQFIADMKRTALDGSKDG